jgi:cobalt-zinc-cadmium efflux system outer membrane protein
LGQSRCACVAALLATGCVSSSTWAALHEVDREVDLAGGSAPAVGVDRGGGERGEPRPPTLEASRGCSAIVTRIVASYPGASGDRSRARAALAVGRAEGAPPAPELMLEVWDFPIGDPQAADREGMYMAGIEQDLPPAGALDGRARAAAEDARIALADLADTERRVRAEAGHACVDWSQASEEIARLGASARALAEMMDVMSDRLASGAGLLADVARIDGERARVEREIARAEAQRSRAEARLRAIAGSDASSSAEASSLLGAAAPPLESPLPGIDVVRLLERAIEQRAELRAAGARARAAAARASAAEAEASTPMFSVRATYMQMPGARPGLGAAVGMTLPWLWSGEGAARDAARLEAEAELDRALRIRRELALEIAGAAGELAAAKRTLDALRARERPAAERALEAISAAYTSGATDLLAWIDAAHMVRDIDLEEARLLGDAAHARVELERAVGGDLGSETER